LSFAENRAPKITTTTEHATAFSRTIVIGDLHGDIEVLLKSLADKGLLRSDGQLAPVMAAIRANLHSAWSAELEAMVLSQSETVQLIFLGDILDRWHQGYAIIQLLLKVRWENFGIKPVFIMGNHDASNFHFFVNPYRAYMLYEGSPFPLAKRMAYLCEMGLSESLQSFLDLHRDEVNSTQERFYRDGYLDWELGYGSLRLSYNADWSQLPVVRREQAAPLDSFCQHWQALLQWPYSANDGRAYSELQRLMALHEGNPGQNWWSILPKDFQEPEDRNAGYSWKVKFFNIFREETTNYSEGRQLSDPDLFHQVLPVDWRVISLIWRRHYGPFFRSLKQMHLEGDTLYAHGGLSPRVMIDSQGLGIIYRDGEDVFLNVERENGYGTIAVVNRANRLTSQVIENALNDYSFQSMSGLEIADLMGSWRGGVYGFPQTGGLFWGDFNYLRICWEESRVQELFKMFMEATCIRRVICGHTRFNDHKDSGTRYLQLEELIEIGMDYLCVDNSCSRGYRADPILNGIEIDANGRVLDPGKYWRINF